jgi:hypothetical protein
LRSFTFGAFDLDGLLFVSHGWFLLLLHLLSQSRGENKEETDGGIEDWRLMIDNSYLVSRCRTSSADIPSIAMLLARDVAPEAILI